MGYNMYGMGLVLYIIEISAVLVAFMILIGAVSIYLDRKRKAEIESALTRLAREHGLDIRKMKGKSHDYELSAKNGKLLIKTVTVPANSSLTINSRNTWCLRYGGSAYHGGYRNMKYLKNLIPFLEAKHDDASKIILVYPSTNKIQRYLNESEIAIVNLGEKVYDYRVITFAELENRFRDLL